MALHCFDTIIIGAGAAGMMCAAIAGSRGRTVLLLDHAKAAGEKIRISGGGRCNFTNLHCTSDNFISQNPHFAKSALAGYSPQDFIDLVNSHKIAWHEKTLGQLFCDDRSGQIVNMLLAQCKIANVQILLQTKIQQVEKTNTEFQLHTSNGQFTSRSLVVACGGLSIPKMGASNFGYQLAKQFGLAQIKPEPALVPFTLDIVFDKPVTNLAGVSLPVRASCGQTFFDEAMLFTHRGLSGPVILQISSYWSPGQNVMIDLAPGANLLLRAKFARSNAPKQSPSVFLAEFLPKRLAACIGQTLAHQRMADFNDRALAGLAKLVHHWQVSPTGTQGFRIAEVTRGGVDTNELSSKTMQASKVLGLYFIGEVVDVTGHLGGHNFQWAWASAAACGRAL